MTSSGHMATHNLHQVIAKALLNPFATMTYFLHSSIDHGLQNDVSSKINLEYISSLYKNILFSIAILAISLISSGVVIDHVGFCGEFKMMSLVLLVILFFISSGLILNQFSSVSGTLTGVTLQKFNTE
jgi:hypothetical protein